MQKPLSGNLLDYGDPLSQGLVGYWLLNEGSGNKVFDLSGNNINGTFVNGPIWTPGDFGSAIDFTYLSSQYITMGDQSLYEFPSQKLTLCIWFKTTQSAGSYPIVGGKSAIGADNGYSIFLNSDLGYNLGIQVREGVNTIDVDCGAVNDGAMHFAALVLDYQTVYGYVDGVFRGTDTNANVTTLASVNDFGFGARDQGGWNFFFDGLISHALLYDHAKTASEIALLHREPFRMIRTKKRRIGAVAEDVAAPTAVYHGRGIYRGVMRGMVA